MGAIEIDQATLDYRQRHREACRRYRARRKGTASPADVALRKSGPRTPPAAVRFWQRVEKTAGCWLWLGTPNKNGYGVFTTGRARIFAHRWAYMQLVGPIPKGLVLDHLCRTPACVNPAHLEPVTQRENVLRGLSLMAQQARQTHCKYGHPFSVENTRVCRDGSRRCRICERRTNRETDARRRGRFRIVGGRRTPREVAA